MPVSVFPHADFDALVTAVIARGWTAPRGRPEPQPVVIPSVVFGDVLQLRLADRTGVCMGLEFITARRFINTAQEVVPGSDWDPDRLAWKLLPHLPAFANNLGVTDLPPRDQFALAGALADQFDQYAHFRPGLVRAWLEGRAEAPGDAGEDWQRRLFGAVKGETSCRHPVEILDDRRGDSAFAERLRRRFPRLLVLGSGVLDPLLIEMIGLLSETGGLVEVHLILPTLEFLGDLRARQALPPEAGDPEETDAPAAHPLLRSMGRHAVGSFLLLGRLDEQFTHWPEPGRFSGTGGTLLGVLQDDIRAARAPTRVDAEGSDRSIRVHACFGPRREMEAVRDEILRAFEEIPGLQPWDIHIVAPSMETYAPLVSAVLEQGNPPLEVRLMSSSLPTGDPVIEGLLALLEMALSRRYEASRVLALLSLRAVQAALAVGDDDRAVDQLRGLVIASGLTQGFGPATEPGTWDFSLARLVAGTWFGSAGTDRYPDGSHVLPVADQLGGDRGLRERYSAWFARLQETLRSWETPAPPDIWAARLEQAATDLLGGADDTLLAIRPHLTFLAAMNGSASADSGALLDWLAQRAGEETRRAAASGRIPFGLLRHLQNLPCRVLILVGMQDGAFPGRNLAPAWDLLRRAPRAWDRNARVDDRQMFLDAVLAARDRLVVTASSRNVRTTRPEPFSSCVDELLRVIDAMGRPRSEIVVPHRLQPFAPDNFAPPAPGSYNAEAAAVAGLLARGETGDPQPFAEFEPSASRSDRTEISLEDLIRFWKDPAAAYLRAQGIRLHGPGDDDTSWDRPPVTLDGLQRWAVQDAILDSMVYGAGDLGHAESVLRADRRLAPGSLGACAWEELRREFEPLAAAVKDRLGPSPGFTVEVGHRVVTGELTFARSGDRLLAWRAGAFREARHLLDPWIRALFASASGHRLPTDLFDAPHGGQPVETPAIPADAAVPVLEALIEGMTIGRETPLPFGLATSSKLAERLKKGLPDALERAAEEWRREADYGAAAGEGTEPAARLAWRDRDPFTEPEGWTHWARVVAEPLGRWKP